MKTYGSRSLTEIASPVLCVKYWIAMTVVVIMIFLSCGLPPAQKAHKILQDGINDESIVVRVNAAKGLKLVGDIQGTKVLYDILRSDDKNGIVAALAALYDLNESTYSPVVIGLTRHEDPLIRAEAFRLVATMNNAQCREILIKGTQDKVAKIRRFAYLGLEKFQEQKILISGLQDIDVLVKFAAAKSLHGLGIEDMENFVRKQLRIYNLEIWKQGLLCLAQMGDTSAIEFIKESLYDAPWELRLTAAEALLILDNKEGVLVIEQGLEANDPFARVKAVQILNNYRLKQGPELLAEAVQDEYINVSVVGIEALAKYRIKENREIFAEMMDAPNPLVKIAAAAAYLMSE